MKQILLLILSVAALPLAAQTPDDAFINAGARELLHEARERRATVDRRIEAYSTTAKERFSVALRAGIVERLIYRRETATRIDWERNGATRLEILGMREMAPMFTSAVSVPNDLSAELLRLSFDPVGTDLFLQVDTVALRHPLAEGSEQHYRYGAGDTTVIRLPDGRTVRLLELRVLPRRREISLLSGSLWLDSESYGVVQIHVRPARGFDADRGDVRVEVAETGDTTTTPRSITLNDITMFARPVRAQIDFIAIDYGLWDMRWWLPRRLAAQGHIQIGGMRVPLTYERTYADYTVRGDTAGQPIPRADVEPQECRAVVHYELNEPARDTVRRRITDAERARRARLARASADSAAVPTCTREYVLSAPSDSALLHSAALPDDPFGPDLVLVPAEELRGILDRMRDVPPPPLDPDPLRFEWAHRGPGLLRYNRVEALSVGARIVSEAEPWRIAATARLGVADLEPRGELGIERRGDRLTVRAAAYRRLDVAHPGEHVPGLYGSLGALIVGRDEEQYYDAAGGEISLLPPQSARQRYDLRLYAERQRAVERNTDFSLAHAINSANTFSPNFAADAADQVGARLLLRTQIGRSPAAPRVIGELSLSAETGDFTILRPEALLRLATPLGSRLTLGVEAAAGTVEGAAIPAQALWRLGGSSTLRGFPASTAVGERYWRARGELGAGIPGARLMLFSDMGWAGDRTDFSLDRPLYSLGVGASFLDGLVRLDLARAMRGPRGWRLHLHFDGF